MDMYIPLPLPPQRTHRTTCGSTGRRRETFVTQRQTSADLVQYQQKDLHQKDEVRGGVEKWKNICAKSLLKHNQEFFIVAWPYMLHS